MVSFLVILASGEQKLVSTQSQQMRIGRMHDCELHIDDPMVSRHHAVVTMQDGAFFLQDAGSRNGTLVNDLPVVGAVELAAGDIIGVGTTRVIFDPPERISFSAEAEEGEAPYFSLVSAPRQKTVPFELLETVAAIAQQIAKEQSLEGLLDSVLTHCVEKTGAERAAILLADAGGELSPCAYRSRTARSEPFVISRSIARRSMTEDTALLIRDVAADSTLRTSESIAGLKIRSAICAPMWNGERKVGLIYLDSTRTGQQFDENDLLFFSALSGMVAEKIENVSLAGIAREKRRLDDELGVAVNIQSRLLPAEIPAVPGYDLSAFNRPCTEMGGDYFDIFAADNRYVIAIADVIGKGIGAAMLMSNLQGMVRSRVTEYADPSAMLGVLNADLSGRIGDNMFITFCYLVLDPGEGEILYANAGHNQPLICRKGGEITELDVSGIPLGIMNRTGYETFSGRVDPGDVLLLYTDGITECANPSGELFGTERLKRSLSDSAFKDADSIRADLCRAVENFREGRPMADDMTLIVVKRCEAFP